MIFSKKRTGNRLALLLALIIALTSMPITVSALGIPPATDDNVPGLAGVQAAGKDMTATGILPLKDVFAGKFLIGTTMSGTDTHKFYHYNAMTPENNTKPQVIWPNPVTGTPSTSYQSTVTSAKNAGVYAIGHALAWHNQSNRWPDRSADRPTWNATTGQFTPLTFYWSYNNADPNLSANAQLERYIKTIAGVFPYDAPYGFDAWDVVNEMMRDNPEHPEDWRNALRRGFMPMMRPSSWYGSYAQGGNGHDYVYDAYRWARQYFPDTILNINDFNDEELPNKAIAIAELVKELNARYAKEHPEDPRKLIEMIGIQAHYNTRMSLDNLEDVLQIYIETGCQIELTELDVSIPKPNGSAPTTAQLQEQARFYARLFRLLNKYADHIHRVSWWGAADNANWRSGFHPMLFSTTAGNTVDGVNRGTPKEAYWATIYPELYLGIPVEPPKLKSISFGGDTIDIGLAPKYDVNVPKNVSKVTFGASNLVFATGVDPAKVDVSVSLSDGGAVSAGKPAVATVKLRWKFAPNNADNTTTYQISFGHMSAEWIKDWNYSDTGYRSAVNVRFSDGVTRLKLEQEFTTIETGEVAMATSKTFDPLPKHGKGTLAVATESKLSDEFLASAKLEKSILDATTGLPFIWTDVGPAGKSDYVWKLNKEPLVPGKTYIIVSSNSGLALTHEGRSSVAAEDGTTLAVQGYFGTEVVTENGIITKTLVAANKIESPVQDHLRFWFKPLNHPNPGQYTAENGYVGFGLQSLVHGGLIEPFFIHRDATTTFPNTLKMVSNNHITHENLDRGVWFNTPINPVTGETTLFLYTPGETPYYYGLAGNRNGFVAERIMDINNPGDLFKVKTYEYVYLDTKAPILTIPADVTIEAEGALTSVDLGNASANDYSAFTIKNNAPENARFPVGVTEVVWTATDASGNAAQATQKVTVVDTTRPVIALTGGSPVNVNQGSTYVEHGATWTDAVDGTGAATVGGDTVDTNVPGTYVVTYDYTDAAGNAAVQVTRTVIVLDASVPVKAFVTRFYELFFDREPDEVGLNYWTNALLNKTTTGADAAAFFVDSDEFRALDVNDSDYLDMMYRAFFDREPDDGGKAYWQGFLDNGMSRYWVLWNFVNSDEFQDICNDYAIERGSLTLTKPADLYPKITAFVTRFYKLALERMPDDDGLNFWVKDLADKKRTGAILADDFIFSAEFTARNTTNDQFVTILYRTFFDREPDSAGFDYWMDELSNGKTRRQVLAGFVYSNEFEEICSDYGIVRGNLP